MTPCTPLLRHAVLVSAALGILLPPSRTYSWECLRDSQGDCVSWINHNPTIYINLNSFTQENSDPSCAQYCPDCSDFANDTHLAGIDWVGYLLLAARDWAEGAGSGLLLTYGGTTTAQCESYLGGPAYSVIGAADFTCRGWPEETIGANPRYFNYQTNAIVDSDVCINSDYYWSFQDDLPSNRLDMRHVLRHELGHFFGADHTSGDSIMRDGLAPGDSGDHELWGDDKAFIRYTYGDRAHAVYGRRWSPPATWEGAWHTNTFTNLPVGAATGRDNAGSWWVIRAEANTSRTGVRFRRTLYPAVSTSTWSSTYYSGAIEHPPAITGTTWDRWWVAAWPIVDEERGCNGLRIGVSADLFQTAFFFTRGDICTSHGVGLSYDHDSARFLLAYVANGEEAANQQLSGQVFVRTSIDGINWSSGNEVYAGVYADSTVSLACTEAGLCGFAYVRSDTNQRYDRQRAFTVGSNGIPVLGGSLSHSNWVYEAPQLFVSRYGSPHITSLLLDFTNLSSGSHSQWHMTDTDFPVGGTWISLQQTSRLRSSVAFNSRRAYATLFYLP